MSSPETYDYRTIDNVIHSRIRLAIMALLASVSEADFVFLRERVRTTDGNLATHMRKLEDAGYVSQEKRQDQGRSRSTFSLTSTGHDAFRAYVDHMESMLGSL